MYIILGQRVYFRRNKVRSFGLCESCGRFAKMSSYDGRNFFHAYYIPLIPTSGKLRVSQACSKCHAEKQLSQSEAEAAGETHMEQSADAIQALLEGEQTFSIEPDLDEDSAVSCLDYLMVAFEWLYCMGNQRFLEDVLQKLRTANCNFEYQMLSGKLALLGGDLPGAISHYKNAAVVRPNQLMPHAEAAGLCRLQKDFAGAEHHTREILRLSPDLELHYSLLLVDDLNAQSKFAEAVGVYQRIIELSPSMAKQSSVKKGLAKARKKSGLPND